MAKSLSGPDRQLCRRLRDPVPSPSGRRFGGDARHDAAAEIDGQRDENARLPPACRIVRLPWVYVRSDVFTANGRGLSRARPARKKVLGVCHRLNELVGGLPTFIPPEAMVYQVNQVLRGWANYFCYGTYSQAFHIVHRHVCRRVRRWLRRKFELSGQGCRQYPDGYLERELGLLNLERFPRRYSWAKS